MKYYRRIFKSLQTGVETTRELLQTMFVGEMLLCGNSIWIVSPWVSNIVIIDNRSGNFDTLNPEWSRREIRLVDVLIALMTRGSKVNIVTGNADTNRQFINSLVDMANQNGLEDKLVIVKREKLHTKGILLSKSLLMGSMNITYNGIQLNDESICFSIDQEEIAATRLAFQEYMGDK